MEVRQGYKKTEIGILPNDWEAKRFTDCADLKHGFQFREEHFSRDGIKVTKIGNLVDGGGVDFSSVTYVPIEALSQFSNFTLNKGDVLMALTGATLGKVSTVDTDEVTLQNYRVGNFFPLKNCTKEYIGCLLQSAFIQKTIKKLVNEAAQPNLGKQDFDKFIVPIPSTKDEQIAIAVALSDTDTLISTLEKLIIKKHNIKQGAMQQLLQPKQGWTIEPLGRHVTISSGESPSKFVFNDYGVPYFKVEQLNNSDKYTSGTPYRVETNLIIRKGSIIFPKRGASIFLNKIRILSEDSFMDTNLMTLTVNEKVSNEYLFYQLTYIGLDRIADTTSIPQINNKHIIPFLLPVPKTKDEQEKIVSILIDMDEEIVSLEKKLSKYRLIREGMMQNLLTGKIRLI